MKSQNQNNLDTPLGSIGILVEVSEEESTEEEFENNQEDFLRTERTPKIPKKSNKKQKESKKRKKKKTKKEKK